MKFATYLINLDRATERLQRMDARLRELAIPYVRVAGVLGDLLEDPIDGFDEVAYRIRTGKRRNKREIGCYFSHLRVIEAFLQSSEEHALVLEDDAELPDDLIDLVDEAIASPCSWDVLRLSSSREGRYLPLHGLSKGRRLVVNTRVLKNTAAYVVNRRAAERILGRLRPMCWPYDVALDRDWTLDLITACVHPFPVGFSSSPGQIPKAGRSPFFRATTFHLFHLIDHIRRRQYRSTLEVLKATPQRSSSPAADTALGACVSAEDRMKP